MLKMCMPGDEQKFLAEVTHLWSNGYLGQEPNTTVKHNIDKRSYAVFCCE